MTVRTRFAPSPTGFLHIGGARTALYNWLFARKHGGQFILRIEDTDEARGKDDSLDIIVNGLRWLGIDWDEGPGTESECGPYFQSQRKDIYERYLQKLEAADLVYEDEGAVRFRVPDKTITIKDLICGDVSTNLKEQGSTRFDADAKKEVESNPDIVIRRPDGSFIFHFVNVVDDIEMGMTHVIRGEDHLSNTAKHVALFEAFGADLPEFAHIPLNLNEDGSRMSKRDRGALIHEYIEEGFLSDAVNNYMALLGWSPKNDKEIFLSKQDLLEAFDLDGVNKSNSKFDKTKCLWVNAQHIKSLDTGQLLEVSKPFLEAANIDPNDARVANSIGLTSERAETLADVPRVLNPIFCDQLTYDQKSVDKVVKKEGMQQIIETLADHLEQNQDWTADAIKASIGSAAESIDSKMGAFMLPCRVAATGSTQGADLAPMMEQIGQQIVVDRIRKFGEQFL